VRPPAFASAAMVARLMSLAMFLTPLSVAAQSAPDADSTGTLQVGDALRITVWRNAELSGEFAVGEDSGLNNPLYQDIKVVGIPVQEVRRRVGEYLAKYQNDPQFVIEPLLQVGVGGMVRTPNIYALPRATTVTQAIVKAGGVMDRADIKKVHLIRGGKDRVIDLSKASAISNPETIRSGDQIVVPRSRDWLRDYAAPVAAIVGAGVAVIALATR